MKRIVYILILCLGCSQLSAQTYDELVTRAMDAVEKDSLRQAEGLFKEALRLEPANMRNALLFSNLGTIQRRMGKNKEALESYSLALNRTPHSIPMLLNRASLYLDMNYPEKAYVDYCDVIDLDPQNVEAYQDAKVDYQKLLDIVPGDQTARIGMAIVNQKLHRYHESLEEFNRLIVDYPKDASLLKARAELEVEMNTPDLALLDLESAASLNPNAAEIYVMCGDIYLSKGLKREAYTAFEKAIELGYPRPELQDKLKLSKKR